MRHIIHANGSPRPNNALGSQAVKGARSRPRRPCR